jgi:hypothetical protein
MAMMNIRGVVMSVFQNIMDMNMRMRLPGSHDELFMLVVSIIMYMSMLVNRTLMNMYMFVIFHP